VSQSDMEREMENRERVMIGM